MNLYKLRRWSLGLFLAAILVAVVAPSPMPTSAAFLVAAFGIAAVICADLSHKGRP